MWDSQCYLKSCVGDIFWLKFIMGRGDHQHFISSLLVGIKQNSNCHNPTQLNQKLGSPYFPMQTTKQQNNTKTVRHFFSAPTQPNSTKLDQIQYTIFFQPNKKIPAKNIGSTEGVSPQKISDFSFLLY